jgi:hypothetical protein
MIFCDMCCTVFSTQFLLFLNTVFLVKMGGDSSEMTGWVFFDLVCDKPCWDLQHEKKTVLGPPTRKKNRVGIFNISC